MTGFAPLLRKELLEQWRTTRLPVVATVFLLVVLSSPLLARFTPEIIKAVGGDQFQIVLPTPTAADAYDQLAKNLPYGDQRRLEVARALGSAPLVSVTIALVLTDLEMPELDGLGLTRAIRADEARSSLPVVIITSRASEDDQRRGIEAGADAYMSKQGFDQQALLATVERLIGR